MANLILPLIGRVTRRGLEEERDESNSTAGCIQKLI